MSTFDELITSASAEEAESPESPIELVVGPEDRGTRLDVFLAARYANHSRVLLRKAIAAGGVTVDGKQTKVAYRLVPGQRILFELPDLPRSSPLPENIPLDVIFEDEFLAVVNKRPGMVVHPARGHWSGTLASALAYRFANLSGVGGASRPGVVHRLDRDTSGVILVAKSDDAHYALAQQFEGREIEKEYAAIVQRVPDLDRDWIRHPIGHHPTHREKMVIAPDDPEGRAAETMYEVRERFDGFALVAAFPKTGRTHQIRVHLASIGCPVLCDRLYGGRAELTLDELTRKPGAGQLLLARQALHARRIKFRHPIDKTPMEIEAALPDDMTATLAALREFRDFRFAARR